MFPLSVVLFPGMALPLHVFEPRYRRLLADVVAGDGRFGVVCISRGSETGGGDERVAVGTTARVEATSALPDGRSLLVAVGEARIRVRAWVTEEPYPTAEVADAPDTGPPADAAGLARAAAALARARALVAELGQPAGPRPTAGADTAWALCEAAPIGLYDRQRLLEAPGEAERLELLGRLCHEVADDAVRLLAVPPPHDG